VFYAQLFWPSREGYMTKSRKSNIKWYCAKAYITEGIVAMSLYAVVKMVKLTPDSWGWDRLISIAIGHTIGAMFLAPVFLMSTR